MTRNLLERVGRALHVSSRCPQIYPRKELRKRLFQCAVEVYEYAYGLRDHYNFGFIRNEQEQKLHALLVYARSRVPFYREYWRTSVIDMSADTLVDKLSLLPILTREHVRAHSKGMLAEGVPEWRIYRGTTSGSTGSPLEYVNDRLSLAASRARYFQLWRWANLDPFDMSILISAPRHISVTPDTIIYIHPTRVQKDFMERIEDIRRLRPTIIRGASLAVLEFAWLVHKHGYRDVSLKAAILYGQAFTDAMRVFIEQTFGCHVFNLYALGETAAVGAECHFHTGIHVYEDDIIVEVVDHQGTPVPRGSLGRIVLTDLTNYCMPLIRYDTGDLGRFLDMPCPCGRKLALLQFDGRREDMLLLPDGKLVVGGVTRSKLDEFTLEIEQWQIIQHSATSFEVKIVQSPRYSAAVESRLRKVFAELFTPQVAVAITYCASIPLESSGKIRQFISTHWRNRFPEDFFVFPSYTQHISASKIKN